MGPFGGEQSREDRMTTRSWTLIGDKPDAALDGFHLGPGDVGGAPPGFSIMGRVLPSGLGRGVQTLQIANGRFALTILPTRGMGIWKAWLGDEFPLGWNSPVRGPVHPALVPLMEPSGLGWLDGFDELLCRCGLVSNGAPEFDDLGRLQYPLHGRIANRPADEVRVEIDEEAGEICVTGVVEETRFLFHQLRLTSVFRTRWHEAGVRIHDQVQNCSARPGQMQLLYHVNFGRPLLEAGARVLAPVRQLVPRTARAAEGIAAWDRYQAPQAGFEEEVYFLQLAADRDGRTRTMLHNAQATRGVSLRFSAEQLPCFSLWKNTAAEADGCVTGLEPGTNYPNPRRFEAQQGRVVSLEPGARRDFGLALEVHATAEEVSQAAADVARLQAGIAPQVFPHPQPGWCAGA